MRIKGKPLILSLVLFTSGFLVAYNYQQTEDNPQMVKLSDSQWEKDYFYKKQLLEMEEKNKGLREELKVKRDKIQEYDSKLASSEEVVADLVQRKNKLQMLAGELPVQGSGVEVTLKDAQYIPDEEQVNQYIVHESHVHMVINELLSAGAKAIAVNGQRIFSDSYISCTGPVITVDGIQHPAPFVITAIGDSDILYSSLDLTQGVIDYLLSDHVDVEMSKDGEIQMQAKLSAEG